MEIIPLCDTNLAEKDRVSKAALFAEKMRLNAVPQVAIDTFLHYYAQLLNGQTGMLPERDIDPIEPEDIDDMHEIASYGGFRETGKHALPKTIVLKLNGGLGTTMGLDGPKSLIPVKDGLSFLDITAHQIRSLNGEYSARIPLLLMNSFKTAEASMKVLAEYPDIQGNIPQSFVQNKFPKVLVSDLGPAQWSRNPALEWNPPGHGDIYASLVSSGILSTLIGNGFRYAFVSNIDNLGATLEFDILGYFVTKGFPFLMEVTSRTPMDRKGGHLARLKDGRLVLRESAQCNPEDIPMFRDIGQHRFFNTNNLWVDLIALQKLLSQKSFVFELPMIRNTKKLDPRNQDSPDVYQLESAMGSAISVFPSASALRVPRSRFVPVKNTDELLLLWSDYFELTEDYRIVQTASTSFHGQPRLSLDHAFYGLLDQLEERFPYGAPSLARCESLTVKGDIRFGKNIQIAGNVTLANHTQQQVMLDDNQIIDQNICF